MTIAALFFTFSRSAWLAAGIWLIVNVIRNWKLEIRNLLYRLLLILALTIIFSPLVSTRLASTTVNETRSYDERTTGYHEAIGLIKQHPFLGVGIGNYTAALYQKNPTLPGYVYQPVHNVPLLFLAELGVVETLLFACIMYHVSCISGSKKCYMLHATCYMTIAPLVLLDHYIFSSYTGLLLTAFFLAFILKLHPQDLHRSSTPTPRQALSSMGK